MSTPQGHNSDRNTNQSENDQSEATEETAEREDDRRARKNPAWHDGYVITGDLDSDDDLLNSEQMRSLMTCEDGDPVTYEEAVKQGKWIEAMDSEIASIERNNTWELVEFPTGGKKIGVKWVYKTKFNENGKVEKYKVRLIAKGYS